MASEQEMRALFGRELALCGVRPGERVAVLSEGDQLQDYRRAFLAAARDLRAEPVDVHLPGAALDANERLKQIGRNALTGDAASLERLASCGLVVDLMLLLFSREQLQLQEAGVRVLLAVEPFEVLQRLFPTPEIRDRVEAGERRLARAHELRFTNPAGTDVRYALAGRPILTEYGYTDTPGRWDHWPSGFLATVAREGGVEGRVVMQPGDMLLPQKELLREPVEFAIEGGSVVAIRGGDEARRLRALMEGYADPRAYAISHVGWGLNDRARWSVDLPGIGMDGRAYYGNVLFSLGPDTEFGGTNDTACHLDLPMRGCTLTLDDELIVEDGRVVPEDMRARAA